MVQWLRLHAANAEVMGSIPGQGTKTPHAKIIFFLIKKKKFISGLCLFYFQKKKKNTEYLFLSERT